MVLNKKMRDGSLIEIEVDEYQAEFLLKHDKNRYSKKEVEENQKIEKEVEEEIPELIDED